MPHASLSSKVRLTRRAARQHGRLAAFQMAAMGFETDQVWRWCEQGLLLRELPTVYAIAGAPRTAEAELTTALLYAGPGAMLTGLVGGWWVGALRDRPAKLTIATPRQPASLSLPDGEWRFDAISVRPRRAERRLWLPRDGRTWGPVERGTVRMPVAPMARLALELARELDDRTMRWALANLEYRRLIDPRALVDTGGRGCSGSARLHAALARHQPLLARCKSRAERTLLFTLQDGSVRAPDGVNVWVTKDIQVDFIWHDAMLIVEIDGEGNHGTPAQRQRDQRNIRCLEALGYTVVRFTEDDLADPAAVAATIAARLRQRATADNVSR